MNGTVTIEIPGNLFQSLKQKADFMHRPVEDLVIQTLAVAAPPADMPSELVIELEAMFNFSDDALWAATKPSIAETERVRLEQLNALVGTRPLSEVEKKEQTNCYKPGNAHWHAEPELLPFSNCVDILCQLKGN